MSFVIDALKFATPSRWSKAEQLLLLFDIHSLQLGLVCFRLRGSDELNQKLLSTINASGRLHMVPASVNDKYVIRFCVCAQNATDDDIEYAWKTLSKIATDVIEKMQLLVWLN